MSDPARQAFDRLYGHLLLSGQDAAWHVFKSGWEAREQYDKPPTIKHLPADDTEGGAA